MGLSTDSDWAWYIDAWAVLDGRLFASFRKAHSIEAISTIFMSVPYLEPIPIGRISTALRATRSGFQEGFRDADGLEIPFESIEDVREIARRTYLAGGLGPGPIAGPPRGAGPPPTDNLGGAYLDRTISELGGDVGGHSHPLATGLPEQFALSHDEKQLLSACVQAFVVACTIELFDSHPGPDDVFTRFCWMRHLRRSGLLSLLRWEPPQELFRVDEHSQHLASVFDNASVDAPDANEAFERRDIPVADLTSQMWLPRRADWDGALTRVSEKLLLPLIDPYYWQSNNLIADLAPVVTLIHLSHGQPYLPHAGDPLVFIDRAFAWLRREGPQRLLPEPAEHALHKLIGHRLNGEIERIQVRSPSSVDGDFIEIAGVEQA